MQTRQLSGFPLTHTSAYFMHKKMKGTHASLSRRVPGTHKDWLLPIHLSNLWPSVRRNSGHCRALLTCARRAVSILLYLQQERHRTMSPKYVFLDNSLPPSHFFNHIHTKKVWRSLTETKSKEPLSSWDWRS